MRGWVIWVLILGILVVMAGGCWALGYTGMMMHLQS